MDNSKTFERIAALFAPHGITVVPTAGAPRSDKCKVSIPTDGVPYCVDMRNAYGEFEPTKFDRCLLHYRLTYARHREKVKAVYDHCARLGLGDVWAMCGGGMQLQVFFGTKAGYLAILYLDLEDLEEQARSADYMKAVGNETFTLVVNGVENDQHFKDFQHHDIEVRFH